MAGSDRFKIFKNVLLFENLPEENIKRIIDLSIEKTFQTGDILIEQDTLANNAYIICSGSVRAYRISEEGDEITLGVLGQGEIVGEMSLLDDEPRSASVAVLQETVVLIINRGRFVSLLKEFPDLTISLLRTLSLRIRTINDHLEDIVSKNLYDRTWKMLLSLSKYFPEKNIALSQEELAEIIGATRARVTEVLNRLKSDGKITLSHREIKLN